MTTCRQPTPDYDLTEPNELAIAAAWRLLELQARDACGWAPPTTTDYEGATGANIEDPVQAELGRARARMAPSEHSPQVRELTAEQRKFATGEMMRGPGAGYKPVPALLPAAVELMEYKDLLLVFATAKAVSPPEGGGVWWSVRMEEGTVPAAAAELGVEVAVARRAMLEYEANIMTGLVACA